MVNTICYERISTGWHSMMEGVLSFRNLSIGRTNITIQKNV